MGLSLLEAAAEKPVSLAEAKAQCRVDGSDDDALITRLIGMATEQAEARTGRVLVTQKLRLTLDAFPADSLEVPCPPLASVQEVSYLDAAGARTVLASTEYEFIKDELVGRLLPAWGKSWPTCRATPGSVRVDFTAGYGVADAVPESIRSWILLAIGTLYSQREALASGQVVELPRAFWDGLLDSYRVWRAL
jgi:uncharacterized phiE125 gp8 family phage protein